MSDSRQTSNASKVSAQDSLRFYARRFQRHPVLEHVKRPLRAAKSFLPSLWRLSTQQLRELPSVVMVGAQKGGTTQLYAYLLNHPRIFCAWKKEVSYFSKHAERSVAWYRSHFPMTRRVASVRGHTLDASPSYLPTPSALRKMRDVLPDARIIVVLRDPVSRAFSHYQHYKTRGQESRSFEQAVEDELRQNDVPPRFGAALVPNAPPLLGYVARGYYAIQLELLFALYPHERVVIVDSADLFADTNLVCQRVVHFLDLEPIAFEISKVYNRGYYKETMDHRVAERLRTHYQPYDAMLAQFTGRQFRWMAGRAAA